MKKIIILLHGVGSSGAGMQGMANYLQQKLPDTQIAVPDGTARFDGSHSGFQWFSVAGITEQIRSARIKDARPEFDAAIQAILELNNFVPKRDKLILVGFSQGAIMALDTLVTDRFPLAGIVAFSGRLATQGPYQVAENSAALLVHGKADPVIEWSQSENAASTLAAENVDVDTFFEPGVPHIITVAGMNKAVEFITCRFSA